MTSLTRFFRLFACLALAVLSASVAAQGADIMPGKAPRDSAAAVVGSEPMPADSVLAELQWPQSLAQRIGQQLLDPLFERTQVGLMVYDLTADSAIFCYNERQTMRPASTMKLVTAIAAIDRLGGSFLFSTQLCSTGDVSNGTLSGDVYLVGGFDPLFDCDDMSAFVESLRGMGVDTLRGRIVADKSMKDTLLFGEGWCWDDDNPRLSPLLVSRGDDFVSRFVDEMAKAGVVVEADCCEGKAPADAYVICTRTHTLDQVLTPMMKKSDNLYAEALFYQLAAATGAQPATARHARRAIGQLFQRLGIDPAQCRIADGSGLSLYNYVTAETEVRLLRHAYNDPNIRLHLLPSLPVAASDGTLERRMKGTSAAGNVRAKTGSVTAVSSLAGYCTAANGHVLCFAIMNQGSLRSSAARAFQDRVCDEMCKP